MDVRPDSLANERRNAVGDTAERGSSAGAVNEGAVEVHAVGADCITRPRLKGCGIQHRDQDNASGDVFGTDFAEQPFERHRSFVFVAVRAAERHEAPARFCVASHPDRERDEVIAPDGVVFERHPVVAVAGRFQVEIVGSDDGARHDQLALCEAMKSASTSTPRPGPSGMLRVPSSLSVKWPPQTPRVSSLWLTLNST